jgi:hypothetical protein
MRSGINPRTPRDWLELCEAWGATGFFEKEPDFDSALDLYRQAVDRGDPQPTEWEWLAEMAGRVIEGKPPATEAEYRELSDWYQRERSAVHSVSIGFELQRGGPRRLGATETAEELRRLRAQSSDSRQIV